MADRILMRATVNLPGAKLGQHVLIDPDDTWMQEAMAAKFLVPVDETPPDPRPAVPVRFDPAPVEPEPVVETPTVADLAAEGVANEWATGLSEASEATEPAEAPPAASGS